MVLEKALHNGILMVPGYDVNVQTSIIIIHLLAVRV